MLLLHVAYMLVHYLFASQTAHVAALSAAFLGMMIAAGVPPVLAALTLTFNSNLQVPAWPSPLPAPSP